MLTLPGLRLGVRSPSQTAMGRHVQMHLRRTRHALPAVQCWRQGPAVDASVFRGRKERLAALSRSDESDGSMRQAALRGA
jgi:hypothetical protein